MSACLFMSFRYAFQLLLEHANEIAPENDPLHDTLAELGDIPDVATLIGEQVMINGEIRALCFFKAKIFFSLLTLLYHSVPFVFVGKIFVYFWNFFIYVI